MYQAAAHGLGTIVLLNTKSDGIHDSDYNTADTT
jgi:hypothetical protein